MSTTANSQQTTKQTTKQTDQQARCSCTLNERGFILARKQDREGTRYSVKTEIVRAAPSGKIYIRYGSHDRVVSSIHVRDIKGKYALLPGPRRCTRCWRLQTTTRDEPLCGGSKVKREDEGEGEDAVTKEGGSEDEVMKEGESEDEVMVESEAEAMEEDEDEDMEEDGDEIWVEREVVEEDGSMPDMKLYKKKAILVYSSTARHVMCY